MKIFFSSLLFLFTSQTFASTYTVELQGLNEELAESSVTGVLVGIKLDDGSILNPSFSQEELRNGIDTKEVFVDDGRSVASCEFNWLLSKGRKGIVPKGFSETSFVGSCALNNGVFAIEPVFEVTKFTLEVLPESMQSHSAYFLLLNLVPEDEESSEFVGGGLTLQNRDLPSETDFRVISSGKPSFKLLTKWLVRGSDPIEETIEIGEETQFTLD